MKTVPNTDKDDSAEEWERIKNFVGGRNKPAKHPLIQEAERQNARNPQHFDEGGDVQPAISGMIPDPTQPAPLPASPSAPAPVAPPAPSSTGKAVNDAMGGVTPEMLKQLADSLNSKNKWGQVGAGIAGIGDAIQSVGGIKGENMQNAEGLIQRNRENALKDVEMQAGAGKQKYELGKDIGGRDPSSVESFHAQQTYGPLLAKMGFKPEEVQKMPAYLINGVADGSISLEKAKGELAIAGATLNANTSLRKDVNAQTEKNERVQRIAELEKQLTALGPIGRNVTDRDTRKSLQEEIDRLKGGSQGGAFDHDSIPPGTKYTAPDGTTRIKK
jgi:hypothetical protein